MKFRNDLRTRTGFISGLAGLAAVVSGCNNNFQKPLEADVPGLPAENHYFDRTMDVFEPDAQKPEGVEISLGTDPKYGGSVNFDKVTILGEGNGRNAPYDVSLVTTDDINGNRQSLVIRDNNETFTSGEAWSIRVYGNGESSEGRKVTSTETFTTFYRKGGSNEEHDDEIDDLKDRVDGIEDQLNINQNTNENDNFNGNMNDNFNDNGNENVNDNNGGNTNDNTDQGPSRLEIMSRDACLLERDSGVFPLLYRATVNDEGHIVASERLDRLGDNVFTIGSRNNGTYLIAVAGGAFEPTTSIYEFEGKLPVYYLGQSDCNDNAILNPSGEDFAVGRNYLYFEGGLEGDIKGYAAVLDIVE